MFNKISKTLLQVNEQKEHMRSLVYGFGVCFGQSKLTRGKHSYSFFFFFLLLIFPSKILKYHKCEIYLSYQ
jgi:hypothetical protein